MQVVAHNLMAQFTDRQLNITTKNKGKSVEKLSSGYRINRSADDAAGLQISEKMRRQIRGLKKGQTNTQEGISWTQIGDGAMEEITDIIKRISELSIQAANDTNTAADRSEINEEIKHLKKEINRIGTTTQYNTKDIFDNSYVVMDVMGAPDDLQIFDATYDASTGDVTFGGFIFNGTRVTWDQALGQNQVGLDNSTTPPTQVFVGGPYDILDPSGSGQTFHIEAQPGAEVPDITRTISIGADASGLIIDGQNIGWGDLVDEDGNALSASNIHGGAWGMDYHGCSLSFFLPGNVETMDEFVADIDSCQNGKVKYTWKTEFTGTSPETAVDVVDVMDIRISDRLSNSITSASDFEFQVKADDTGIWLENPNDHTVVQDSKKSWSDLGIDSWDSGSYINKTLTYNYPNNTSTTDADLSFDFKLSDVTSVDSVIDGLDGMRISGSNIVTNYSNLVNINRTENIVNAGARNQITVSYAKEKILGRNFDDPNGHVPGINPPKDVVDNVPGSYNSTTKKASIQLTGTSNSAVDFEGDTTTVRNELKNDLNSYLGQVARSKVQLALEGKDPQDDYEDRAGNLLQLLGEDHVTTSGYFSEDMTMTAGMLLSSSDGTPPFYPAGNVGSKYPAAYINFSSLQSLDDLNGLGFNSTCQTCSNHYSVMFVDSLSGAYSTDEGYEYQFKEQGNNFELKISLDSLKGKNIDTNSLPAAICKIASEKFDFHFTQYAAEGSKLWLYDDRTDIYNRQAATFDLNPFMSATQDIFKVHMADMDNNTIDAEYTYDFKDAHQLIYTEMVENASGEYVLNDPADVDDTQGYRLYDSATDNGRRRFDKNETYKNADGTDAADLASAIDSYIDKALDTMLTNTHLTLHANDYTYADMSGNELPNVAIRANFDSVLEETPYENGIHIQNSSNVGDAIIIPRFPMNTVYLHINRADVTTAEKAQKSIEYAHKALEQINDRRDLYGAYQNRMEHIVKISANTEENMQSAESQLRDTDMSEELVKYSKHNILEQAGQSMLAQANQQPQGILSLLQ